MTTYRRATFAATRPALRVITGKNHPCYGKRWGLRTIAPRYWHLHAGPLALSVESGAAARRRNNGMYHSAHVGPVILGAVPR